MRQWTTQEIRVLRSFASLGRTAVATMLERSERSVAHKASELKISLEVTGEEIEINATIIDLIERIRETPSLRICPMCAKRLASMRTSGMCRCCHLDRLIDLQQEQLDVKVRQQRLDKARQAKHRARVCDQCNQPFFPRTTSQETTCAECGD